MASGRQPHENKITVYLTEEEYVELEEEKLRLRKLGYKSDRGNLVRAMIEVGLQRPTDVKRLLKKKEGR